MCSSDLICVVAGLLVFVVPQIVQVFQHSRQSLPILTRALIALSGFLHSAWPFLAIAAVGALVGARLALRRPSARRFWHGRLLNAPWLGSIIRGVNTSRFASTLAILVGGGVPLLSALNSGARVMTNQVMRDAIEGVIDQIGRAHV